MKEAARTSPPHQPQRIAQDIPRATGHMRGMDTLQVSAPIPITTLLRKPAPQRMPIGYGPTRAEDLTQPSHDAHDHDSRYIVADGTNDSRMTNSTQRYRENSGSDSPKSPGPQDTPIDVRVAQTAGRVTPKLFFDQQSVLVFHLRAG